MSRASRAVLIGAAAVATGFAGLWAFTDVGSTGRMAAIVGACAAAAVTAAVVGGLLGSDREPAGPDAFEELWLRSRAPAASMPDAPEVKRLAGLVRVALGSAGGAHHGLHPLLRDIAEAQFEATLGTHPDRDPRAPEVLGPTAWAWVRPDRPPPEERLAPGPGRDELDAVLTALEQLGGDGGPRRG